MGARSAKITEPQKIMSLTPHIFQLHIDGFTMHRYLFIISALWLFTSTVAVAEPVVVVVNSRNPVNSLSKEQVQRYFLLTEKKWPGGEKVKPLGLKDDLPTKNNFISSILGLSQSAYSRHWLRAKQRTGEVEPRRVKSEIFVSRIVGSGLNSIGYVSLDYYKSLSTKEKENLKVVFQGEMKDS